jgi:photosystem II stability/assembly factor-like uncharacterized protein
LIRGELSSLSPIHLFATDALVSMFRPLAFCHLVFCLATSGANGAAKDYDFYICARISRDTSADPEIETASGLFRFGEDGDWHHFGANDTTISAFAIDPDDRNILYTTTLNGLWRSRDGGKNWRIANNWEMTEGRDVSADPNTPGVIYVAFPDGIAVSTDRAETLERRETGLPDRGKYTEAIEVDRMAAGRVLAGTASGIYLTEDSGGFWRCVFPTRTTVNDIQQAPHDPETWMAVTDTNGAWISRDRGLNWTLIEGLPSEKSLYALSFDPTNPKRLAVGSWSYGVLVSEDGGVKWIQRNEGLPQPHRVMRVGIHPNTGRLYASLFQGTLYHSDDLGRTWSPDSLAGATVARFVTVPGIDR